MAWALVDSWTYSSPVAQADFIGLAGYTDVRVLIRGITVSASGFRGLRVSTDNGSTFLSTSGDYINVDSAGAEVSTTGVTFISAASTAARSGVIEICGFNLTAQKVAQKLNRTDAHTTLIPTASALNAVRVYDTAGGNLTAGSIYVFAR